MTSKSQQKTLHEDFSRRDSVVAGSERSFGSVMAAVIAVIALITFWRDGRDWPWMAGLSCFLLAAAWLCPMLLKPANRLWLWLGLILHAVINSVVMGFLFYLAVWPTAIIMRTMGKDLLRLKPQYPSESYWIVRRPPGPGPGTMKDQF